MTSSSHDSGFREMIVFGLLLFSSVFSLSLPMPFFPDRFIQVPIEILCAPALLFFPYLWPKSRLLFFFLLSVLVSAWVFDTALSGVRYVTGALSGCLILGYLFRKTGYDVAVWFWSITLTGISLFVALVSLSAISGLTPDLQHGAPFLGSRLSAGFVLSLCVWSGVVLLAAHQSKFTFPAIIGVVAGLLGIGFLHARAPLYSLIFVFLLFSVRLKRWLSFGLISLFAMALLTFHLAKASSPNWTEGMTQRFFRTAPFSSVSFEGRMKSWKNYLDAAKRYPLGMGFERSLDEFHRGRESHRWDMTVAGAHNEFLKILLELGWLPFSLFLLVHMKCLMEAVRYLIGSNDVRELMFGGLFLVSLFQFLVNNEMQQPEVAYPYWFVLGVVLHLRNTRKKLAGKELNS